MKNVRSLSLAVGIIVAAGGAQAADAHRHDAHEHASHPAKLQLNNGKKWQSDEALRSAMGTLRTEFAGKLHAIHTGKLSPDGYRELGGKVDGAVANIVAQCKLEPKADAMLHIVIADLVAGAEIMQGKAEGKPEAGAHKAAMALNAYGRHFDHPNWKPLK